MKHLLLLMLITAVINQNLRSQSACNSNSFSTTIFTTERTPLVELEKRLQEHLMNKQHEDVVLLCDEIIKQYPDYGKAYYYKAQALFQQKDFLAAIDYFHKVENSMDENSSINHKELLTDISNCYQLLKNYGEALSYLNKALKVDDKDADLYFQRANILYYQQNWQDAILNYSKSINLNQENIHAFYYRAMAHRNVKDFNGAIKDFNYVLENNPTLNLALLSRGYTYGEMQEYQLALEDYNKVLATDTEDAATYIRRGYILVELNAYDKAIQDFNKSMEISSDYKASALNNRANARRLKGDLKGALEDIKASQEIDDENPWLHINYALLYADMGEFDKSQHQFDLAIELNSQLAAIYFYRAAVYKKMMQYDKAIVDYNTLQRIDSSFRSKELMQLKEQATIAFLGK